MAALLNTLLKITVYSGMLFLVILMFKKVFQKHISALLNYMVWMLLIVRLLIPVTIDSSFRLIVIPENTTQVVQAETDTNLEFSFSTQSETEITGYTAQPQLHTMQQPLANTDVNSNNASIPAQVAPVVHIDWKTAIVLAWALGMICYFAYIVTLNMRFRQVMKQSDTAIPADVLAMVDDCKKELGIKSVIPVSLQKRMTTPAMTLSFRPVLLLPESMLEMMSPAQVKLGIRHELTHYKRKDHLMRLLLLLLRGVYWFNPFFWFAYRMILADMETVCDAHVTARLEKEQRDLYIHTIIDLGSDSYTRCALGMGANFGKKSIEKRIRGMFMKKKSKRFVRVSALLLVPLMLIMCFTTACQPTPEEVVVVGKGDGLSDLIQSTPGASSGVSSSKPSTQTNDAQTNDALYTKLGAPKHWNFETTELGGKLNITADVDVELPGVSQLPAATASLNEFAQEDLEKIAEVLGVKEGAVWTEIDHTMTKEQITQEILDYQARRAEFEAEGDDELVAHMDTNIEAYKQMYIDAPDEIELENIEFKISQLTPDGDSTFGIGFRGITQVDGNTFFFLADNSFSGNRINRVAANFGTGPDGFGGVDIDKPLSVSLTKEQAAQQASEIAKQLTDELTLCYITPAAECRDESRNWGWACVFMREINGCPTAYETTAIGCSLEAVSAPVDYEKMIIVIDDMGTVCFEWEVPMTIESIDNPDVSLLSFEEISQRAIEQVAEREASMVGERIDDRTGIDWGDPGCTANIKKVKLGLMRVAKANSNDFYYMPVWKFFVDIIHTDEYYERTGSEPLDDTVQINSNGIPNNVNGEYSLGHYNVITLNALDGSVIDRDLGY